jgi:uncharacterized protein YbjT (DUF2867 family)
METQEKRAILLGGSGLVGGQLLQQLLSDARYSEIRAFTRSELPYSDPKLRQYLVDLMQPDQYREDFKGDVVFCCVGTTRAKTPDLEPYREVDYGIPVRAASLAKAHGIPKLVVVSALGANADSRLFYNRIKGEMERDVLAQGLARTHILQPALIGGKRDEFRMGERAATWMMRLLEPILVGKLRRYRIIKASSIASCMRWLGVHSLDQTRIPSERIREIAKEQDRNQT